MANKTTQWVIELVDRLSEPMKTAASASNSTTDALKKATEAVKDFFRKSTENMPSFEKFGKGMMYLNQTAEAVQKVTDSYQQFIDPGVRFQYAVADMQALTGQSAEVMDQLSNKARETAKVFGSDAADAVEVFKVYLSKLTPELASSPEALNAMAINALTLSKTMGNDVAGAVDVLTTAMNQFQVSTDDPVQAAKTMTEMMNVMAAGAREGSAEIIELKAALEQSGMMAKMANVSFVETNAAIQVLDKAGKKGSEGGVALRNVLTTLAQGRFLPKDVIDELKHAGVSVKELTDKSKTLAERLQILKPIMNDDALLAKMFGRENVAAGLALLNNIPLMNQYTQAIQGTNTATEQASIVMNTYYEESKRTTSWIDNLKISMFNATEGFAPFISLVGKAAEFITSAGIAVFAFSQIMKVSWVSSLASAIKSTAVWVLTTVTGCETVSAAIYSIPIIGWIALAIAAIGTLVAYFYNTSEKFRGILWGVWYGIKSTFTIASTFIKETLGGIWDLIKMVFNPAKWFDDDNGFEKAFERIKNAGVDAAKAMKAEVARGVKAGVEDYRSENPEEQKKSELTIYKPGTPTVTPGTITVPGTTGDGKVGKGGGGLSGSGSGSVRNVNMTVNFSNHFAATSKDDVRAVAEQVMQQITGVLRDSLIALD